MVTHILTLCNPSFLIRKRIGKYLNNTMYNANFTLETEFYTTREKCHKRRRFLSSRIRNNTILCFVNYLKCSHYIVR